jgi:pimeloyl-ACP methyl ester carboxylesterase
MYLLIIILLLLALLIGGWIKKRRLEQEYPPKGRLVDMGDYRLHIHCSGEGGPAVVMDAGQGESGLAWAHIQAEVARHSQACVYDRGGLGWSDPSPRPRTALEMAAELRALLHEAGIAGPYLLVGASLGGLNARVFAHQYPQEVAGLVLVDAAHEDQYTPEPLKNGIEQMSRMAPLITGLFILLVKSGLAALFPRLIPRAGPGMPAEAAKVDRALRVADSKYFQASAAEISDVLTSHAQVREMKIDSLGDIPLIVIRHGKVQTQMMPELTEVMEETNRRLQAQVAEQSTGGRLVVADESGHAVQFDQPQLVVDCILEALAEARA